MRKTESVHVPIRPFDLVAGIVVSLVLGFSLGRLWSNTPSHVAGAFHHLYFGANLYNKTYWFGHPIQKLPLDQWIYQEILYETKPDVLLEMGTFKGGSALYFAHMFDLLGNGRVITVDIEKQPNQPVHPRITYLRGSSTSDEIVSQIKSLIKPGEGVMAVLDSDHRKFHVLNELRIYSEIVTPGHYLVTEDTNLNGHPVEPGWGDPGPWAAVQDFLKENHAYVQDRSREKFKFTFYPGGWLKRIR